MEKSLLFAVAAGVVVALGVGAAKNRGNPAGGTPFQASNMANFPEQIDPHGTGPDAPDLNAGDDTTGWITVLEPKADWNLSDSDLVIFICPRPEWYPYHTFRGPPVPESTLSLDPSGYVMRTAQGVRLHRDGWVVTSDGRAYRAEEQSELAPYDNPQPFL